MAFLNVSVVVQEVRKNWPVIEIKGAGHLSCIIQPQFKLAVLEWAVRNRRGEPEKPERR